MKKIVALALALVLVMAAACASAVEVGICQLVQHPALDAATQGFKDALSAKMPDVTFDEQNASGDAVNCATIINTFVSNNVDLILANATPALQAAVAATADIPILGTSITEYGVALGIDDFNGVTGINVSGTSDLAPLSEQAAMVKELFPEAKKVGLVYCSAEANSIYQVKVVGEELVKLGYETEEYAFTDSNDVASVTQSAADSCDVIYIPTDNTAAAYTETIANVVIPANIPVIAGEEGICAGCGVATLTISYYDIGYKTGEMAYEILANGADVSAMPIEYAPQFTKKYNAENVDALGIEIPEGYVAIE
ncbi:MAG: ABC transporter substrate-binding protein [Clostridiales bacterium]|nr:ABC transporter substrate-binding protein [Clostridiales bacterium]MDY5349315.1 ABC transporter substrate-binding protein [Candidatus Ventricola sp.]MDY5515023.1 ABC transporter substrate-binding protein [Candidatus Ventricola sp.]